MKQRLITAVFGFAVLAPVLLFSHTPLFPIAVGLFTAIAVWEMLGCIGVRRNAAVTVPSLILAALIPIAGRLLPGRIGGELRYLALAAALVFFYMFYLMCLAVTSKGKFTVGDLGLVFMTAVYIIAGFTSLVLIRDGAFGEMMILLVFVGAWVTDGAAYFVGRALGRHKLIPDVSPKKTVEGAIGGSFFCGICFALFGLIAGAIVKIEPNLVMLAAAGLVISVISQFGDLIASLIKRQYEIKDYGTLFPGHGGVMDRFDSIIAVAPVLLMLAKLTGALALFA